MALTFTGFGSLEVATPPPYHSCQNVNRIVN